MDIDDMVRAVPRNIGVTAPTFLNAKAQREGEPLGFAKHSGLGLVVGVLLAPFPMAFRLGQDAAIAEFVIPSNVAPVKLVGMRTVFVALTRHKTDHSENTGASYRVEAKLVVQLPEQLIAPAQVGVTVINRGDGPDEIDRFVHVSDPPLQIR